MNILIFQQKIFEQIKEKNPNQTDFISDLSEILNLGTSAIYKRMRGDVLLNVEELFLLSTHYKISLDQFFLSKFGFTTYHFRALTEKPKTLEKYLETINTDIGQLSKSQDTVVYYVSNDLPIFYYFLSPELLTFKLFIWARTIWEWPGFHKKKFDIFQMMKKYPVLKKEQSLNEIYQSIPSVEFWKESILDHLLRQIKFYYFNDVFAKESDAFLLCDQLQLLIQKIEEMALRESKLNTIEDQTKKKNDKKAFKLYQNEINNTDNIILIQSKEINTVYTTFDSPNFQVTSNPSMIRYSKDWFERIQKRSKLISGSEGNCLHFFNSLKEKIKETKIEMKNRSQNGKA